MMRQDEAEEWGYGGHLVKPEQWNKFYKVGSRQSPIDILVEQCDLHQHNHNHHQLQNCYEHNQLPKQLKNNLNINGSNQGQPRQQHIVRTRIHLDSSGEQDNEHLRSPSTSSNGSSSANSSPSHSRNGFNNDEDLYYNDGDGNADRNNNNNDDDDGRRTTGGANNKLAGHRGLGKRQELEQRTRRCISNKKIFLGYPRYLSSMRLCNTGHNWQINLAPEISAHTRK